MRTPVLWKRALVAGAILSWIAPAVLAAPKTITVPPPPPNATELQLLDNVQHRAFAFFWNESHPDTGLCKDRARNLENSDTLIIASTAATGYALAALPIGVERGWVRRDDAYQRALTTLRYVHDKLPNNHGFYYHFLHWQTGARQWNCELSSIDSTLLVMGALAAAQYWRGTEVDRLANAIYARMDWPWMQRGDGSDPHAKTISHGWKPEGWLKNRWARYDEASYLYFLAMGAPTRPLGADAWNQWQVPMAEVEGYPVFGGPHPIFFSQMVSGYFNLQGLRDRQNRDWWTNWRNDHLANRAYCARKAGAFKTFAPTIFGINASDKPGGYGANAPTDERNDGTVTPTGMIGGIFIVPGLSLAAMDTLWDKYRDKLWGRYGFSNAFNVDKDWYDKDVIGIDLGMMILSIENYRSGLIWKLMRTHPAVQRGLNKAGMHPAPSDNNFRTAPMRRPATPRTLPAPAARP